MRTDTKKTLLILLFSAIGVGLMFLIFIGYIMFSQQVRFYTPAFAESDWEIVEGTYAHGSDDGPYGVYVFYAAEEAFTVGEVIDPAEAGIQIIVASHNSFTPLQVIVQKVTAEYVLFRLELPPDPQVPEQSTMAFNPDCVGIYDDDQYVTGYQHTQLGLLPRPSDSWMCAGYDFETPPQK
jgi:hypothetical protein